MNLKPNQVAIAHDVLPKIALCSGISVPQTGSMVEVLEFKSYKAGKVVLMEQEISKSLFILVSGSVGIWHRDKGQNKQIAVLKAPDFFGEVSMWTDSPATALVKTVEDSDFLVLSRANFDVLAAKDPAWVTLIQNNIAKVRENRPAIQKQKPAE